MSLTPIDVQQKTFGTALRGYDLDEVDDFLDEIVTSLKDYEQRLRDAQERIATLESDMADRGDAEGAISRALVAAQRSADAIVDEARAEAERVVSEARAQADEIVVQREQELSTAQDEVDRLRTTVEDLKRRVRQLADDLDDSLDEMTEAIDDAESALETGETDEGNPAERPRHIAPEDDLFGSTPDLDVEHDSEVEEDDAEFAATESGDSTYDPTIESTYERVVRPWEDS